MHSMYTELRLSNIISTCTIWACAKNKHIINFDAAYGMPLPRLLSFDALVFQILPGLLSILWYRWTFQGGSSLWEAYSALDS